MCEKNLKKILGQEIVGPKHFVAEKFLVKKIFQIDTNSFLEQKFVYTLLSQNFVRPKTFIQTKNFVLKLFDTKYY